MDPAAEALAAAGGAIRLGRIVTGGPDGEIRFTAVVADGAVTYLPGLADDVDVTLTDTAANARAMASGELDPNAAFMRGRTKVAGAIGPLLALLAATRSEVYAERCRELVGG
jgi:putative sterol carrier protein